MGKIQDAQDQYYRNLKDEDIDDLVSKGMNKEQVLKLRSEAIAKQKERLKNETHLERLDEFKKVPRDINSDFCKRGAGKAPLFGKTKFFDKVANAPLIYGAVVQAHGALWEPGDNDMTGIVIVFALDEKHRYDKKYLREVADKIACLKKESDIPADMSKLIKNLRNDQSTFYWKVGESVAGSDAETWCVTYVLKNCKMLPKRFIPNDKFIPFLVKNQPQENVMQDLLLIVSSEFYE